MSLYQQLLTRALREDQGILPDWQRLRLLENAVLHYGGGLGVLLHRVETIAIRQQQNCPEAAAVLDDVACYLRDVAIAGRLDTWDNETFLQEMRQ